MFLAQALGRTTERTFLFKQAAYQMRGAVLSMWAASGEDVPDRSPKTIAEAEQLLGKGKLGAYATLKSEVDRLRLLSQSHLNGVADEIRARESRIEALQARESWLYLAYVFFNLLALMVTMCKDLPIWRADAQGARVA